MAVYIAVCDDNVADRKQFERLLEREKKDRVNKNEVLYIDSFGSKAALMHTPVKYDLFLLDITKEKENGMDIAKSLRNLGISAPIVLFSSSIDYKTYGNPPKDIAFYDKPVTRGQLAHIIDDATIRAKSRVPLIEIRCNEDTIFVKHTDIVTVKDFKGFLIVELIDGKQYKVYDTLKRFCDLLTGYNTFLNCKNQTLVNMAYIVQTERNSFLLSTNEQVPFSVFQRKSLLDDFARFSNK